MTDAVPTPAIAELAEAIAALDTLDDTDRIAAARRLAVSAPQVLARHADEWTYDATRTTQQHTVARRLGVTPSQIERAIARHRQRHPGLGVKSTARPAAAPGAAG